ncbi:MAG: type II toxin-antitoxin system VapC family toxin [Candidatus Rokubacteria bacterium]|nr:type II toxin-antitoxin system VapC family toxin [Candidatus Rokubacteria bacterium]
MILYVDTSALVKVYVEEDGTLAVLARVDHAEAVATALVTYAEARAALARHRREGGITGADLRRAVRELDRDWRAYNVVDLSDALVHSAGALAERHALRGYDAVHLAAALELRAVGGSVEFCAFDGRLNRAARRERLVVIT